MPGTDGSEGSWVPSLTSGSRTLPGRQSAKRYREGFVFKYVRTQVITSQELILKK